MNDTEKYSWMDFFFDLNLDYLQGSIISFIVSRFLSVYSFLGYSSYCFCIFSRNVIISSDDINLFVYYILSLFASRIALNTSFDSDNSLSFYFLNSYNSSSDFAFSKLVDSIHFPTIPSCSILDISPLSDIILF